MDDRHRVFTVVGCKGKCLTVARHPVARGINALAVNTPIVTLHLDRFPGTGTVAARTFGISGIYHPQCIRVHTGRRGRCQAAYSRAGIIHARTVEASPGTVDRCRRVVTVRCVCSLANPHRNKRIERRAVHTVVGRGRLTGFQLTGVRLQTVTGVASFGARNAPARVNALSVVIAPPNPFPNHQNPVIAVPGRRLSANDTAAGIVDTGIRRAIVWAGYDDRVVHAFAVGVTTTERLRNSEVAVLTIGSGRRCVAVDELTGVVLTVGGTGTIQTVRAFSCCTLIIALGENTTGCAPRDNAVSLPLKNGESSGDASADVIRRNTIKRRTGI